MLHWLQTITMQEVLVGIGFCAFTWGFVVRVVPVEVYTPTVAMMLAFFFKNGVKPS